MDASRKIVIAPLADGATATNFVQNSSRYFSMTLPNGVDNSISSTLQLQVNNSNLFNQDKPGHYIAPIMYAFKSSSQAIINQASATASDFEANWVDYAAITGGTTVSSSGIFRYIRFRCSAGFSGAGANFRAIFFNDDDTVY